ncbi:hypothetical protein P5V15_007811 [Pogonomyrmex californicus]
MESRSTLPSIRSILVGFTFGRASNSPKKTKRTVPKRGVTIAMRSSKRERHAAMPRSSNLRRARGCHSDITVVPVTRISEKLYSAGERRVVSHRGTRRNGARCNSTVASVRETLA